ncbi:MAG: DUF3843 family protein [Prevotella sp.]|nr:DUF3843 family protein [Bacteroides sp.]MCM1366094.1 DUF3843 family protein [Prevotella sp.]MCM1436579.1 DUF3843 family protein [Prevotella sp.]
MKKVTPQQFLLRQPCYPEKKLSDIYYYELTNTLLNDWDVSGLFPTLSDEVKQRVALNVIGYYQDIISDGGLWRAFTRECQRLYGYKVPFYEAGDDYVDFELNLIDVKFMIWYSIAMLDMAHRDLSPTDCDIKKLAQRWHKILDENYEEAPEPEDYNIGFELEMHNPEDAQHLLKFTHWIFLHSYLLTPSFALMMAQMAQQAELDKDGGELRLNEMLEEGMTEQPIGPLALYIREWLSLILHDRMPESHHGDDVKELHRYYKAVTEYTGGKRLVYFAEYTELNKFLINVLGWEDGVDHLPQFKQYSDFVIQVDSKKGMLLARNVAKCIADPENKLYNSAYASKHAFDLLTVRGLCPGDLLKTILRNGWLPDAVFPGTDDKELVRRNADFIARCYLQLFYRGD